MQFDLSTLLNKKHFMSKARIANALRRAEKINRFLLCVHFTVVASCLFTTSLGNGY